MTDSGKIQGVVAIALLAAMLSACAAPSGGSSDDSVGGLLVAPGKYTLYSCPEIATAAKVAAARVSELEKLIAKAGEGAGGKLASSLAYRPEYLERRGEINELRRAATAKNCKSVPGLPGARASDDVVR